MAPAESDFKPGHHVGHPRTATCRSVNVDIRTIHHGPPEARTLHTGTWRISDRVFRSGPLSTRPAAHVRARFHRASCVLALAQLQACGRLIARSLARVWLPLPPGQPNASRQRPRPSRRWCHPRPLSPPSSQERSSPVRCARARDGWTRPSWSCGTGPSPLTFAF